MKKQSTSGWEKRSNTTGRKTTIAYDFSVEGQTELWYLKWLQSQINDRNDACCHVSLTIAVKSPTKYVRDMSVLDHRIITHVFDYESNEPEHNQRFERILDEMKRAEKSKSIKYQLGYSNFSFELWMILHKKDCNGLFAHRSGYLAALNAAYEAQFESLDVYKQAADFERILKKLCLDDVIAAVHRSEKITRKNMANVHSWQTCNGFTYCKDNPSLSIGEVIGGILRDCGLMSAPPSNL
ncbi:MAG: RloB family protein [Clostridia bacterium]